MEKPKKNEQVRRRWGGRVGTTLAAASLLTALWACAPGIGLPAVRLQQRAVPKEEREPAAKALLDRTAAAYRALSSYAGTLEVRGEASGGALQVLRAGVVFQRPGQAAVTVDSRRLTTETPAGGGDAAITGVLEEAVGPTVLGRLLRGQDPLLLSGKIVTSLSLGDRAKVGGIPAETVVAVLSGPDGEETVTLAIGQADHLLRQVTVTGIANGKPFQRSEAYTDVRVNPVLPPAMFAPAAEQPLAPADSSSPAGGAAPAANTIPQSAQVTPGFALPAPAVPTAPTSGPAPETASPGPLRYDAGSISLVDQTHLERVFRLKNTTGAPLKLARLDASCGCLSSIVEKVEKPGKKGVLPATSVPKPSASSPLPTLAPGEEAGVRVTIDLRPLPAGSLHKVVSVYAEGKSEPVARFEINGTLVPAVAFSPRLVDFGRVAAGKNATARRTITLTATVDARLAAAGKLPPLTASNPFVRITELPNAPASGGPAKGGSLTRTYTVALALDAPLGPVSASVSFSTTTGTSSAASVAAALRGAAVPVMGEIVGPLTAQPQAVAFGLVTAGQSPTRDVLLTGDSAATLAGVRITPVPGAPVTAQLVPAADGARARTLKVTLGPKVPPGAFRTEVTLTLPSGERLSVPVSAYVAAAPNAPGTPAVTAVTTPAAPSGEKKP